MKLLLKSNDIETENISKKAPIEDFFRIPLCNEFDFCLEIKMIMRTIALNKRDERFTTRPANRFLTVCNIKNKRSIVIINLLLETEPFDRLKFSQRYPHIYDVHRGKPELHVLNGELNRNKCYLYATSYHMSLSQQANKKNFKKLKIMKISR